MNNIFIDTDSLDNLIVMLKNNNEKIVAIVKDINKNVFDIDSDSWQSPEKNKVDEQFVPYLKRKETAINNAFNNCNTFLNDVKNAYLEYDNQLTNKIDSMFGVDNNGH